MFRATAAKLMLFAWDTTTGVAKTGDAANITAYISKDYGAVTALGDTSATEMDSTNAKGYYLVDVTGAEMTADVVMVSAKSATANIAVIGAPAVIFTRPATGWLAPTVAGRTLDVSAGGEAGVDWANVGSPTTVVGLSGTTVKTATDVETDTADIQSRLPAALTAGGNIKADALALSGDTVAADNAEAFFDGTGYAGTNNVIPTVTTVTNLTNAPTNGDLTATMKTSVTTAATAATPTAAAVTGAVGSVTGNVGGNVAGSVGSVTGNVGGNVVGSVGSLAAQAKADVNAEVDTALADYDAPTSAELVSEINAVQADIATVDTVVDAIKVKTDSLTFTTSGQVDSNVQYVNDVQVTGVGTEADPWGPA